MLSALWGRITGKDKRKQYPDQQAVFLGRVGDYTILSGYGVYADLPPDTLLLEIRPGVAIPVTVTRPDDTAQGEPVFFHPATGTRIIPRNNGDLDITCDDGAAGNLNIQAVNVNLIASEDVSATIGGNLIVSCVTADVTASTSVDVHSPVTNLGDGGQPIARLGDTVQVEVTSGSSAGTYNGTITSGGVNTSI